MKKGSEEIDSDLSFQQRARDIIKRIPRGRVVTYGQIAACAGNPRASRQVVRILNTYWEKDALPWHRVINRRGRISLEPGRGYEIQRQLLEQEGVIFDENDTIDPGRFLWSLS